MNGPCGIHRNRGRQHHRPRVAIGDSQYFAGREGVGVGSGVAVVAVADGGVAVERPGRHRSNTHIPPIQAAIDGDSTRYDNHHRSNAQRRTPE